MKKFPKLHHYPKQTMAKQITPIDRTHYEFILRTEIDSGDIIATFAAQLVFSFLFYPRKTLVSTTSSLTNYNKLKNEHLCR